MYTKILYIFTQCKEMYILYIVIKNISFTFMVYRTKGRLLNIIN